MNLNHLAIFLAVAEEGSVSRGAERLFITQPAVSKQLADLERTLDLRLFDRLPKGVRLTQSGELLLGYARRLFAVERDAERALAELKGLTLGRLAVGASTTIGGYLLPNVLAPFHRRYPAIELQLTIANTDRIQHQLLEGALDLGLTEGFIDSPDLEAEVFMTDELVAIAAPGHPILQETPVTAERLCRERIVVREEGSGTRAIVEHALLEKGFSIVPTIALGSTEAIKRAVAAGVGIAVVSRLTIGLETAAGRVSVVELADLDLRRPLHRLRLKGKQESRAVRAFNDRLRRSLGSRLWMERQVI